MTLPRVFWAASPMTTDATLATATRLGLCSNELEALRYFPPRRVALFSERIEADTEVL
jgi:hypothetical protein